MKMRKFYLSTIRWRRSIMHSMIAAILLISPSLASARTAEYPVPQPESELQQPTHDVSGVVRDDAGQPLLGVTVVVKDTDKATVTDVNGNFRMQNVNSNASLVFSFVGMETREVAINGRTNVDIVLNSDVVGVDEVVVVGYATQKKVNVIGSISTISSKSIENRSVTNLSSALAGLAAGVYVHNTSGKPGADGADILIRGTGTLNSTSPLVIIDGIPGSSSAVNPNDVESISVLKDAATAAIYGSLASNGVILITTKSGSSDKVTVNYSGNFSIIKPNKIPGFISDYGDHMRFVNEAYTNVGQAAVYSQSTMDLWEDAKKNPNAMAASGFPNYVAYPNTNWSEEVFRNKVLQNHNISLSGGGKNTKYLLSSGYMYNPGTMPNTGAERYQLRINLQSKVADFLTIGTQTYGSYTTSSVADMNLAFQYLLGTVPGVYPKYDDKYGFPAAPEESATANNPLAQLYSQGGKNISTLINTTVYANFDIVKGLKLEMKAHYDASLSEGSLYNNAYDKWNFATGNIASVANTADNLWTQNSFYKSHNVILDNVLRYNNTIGKHDIGAIAGYNQQSYKHNNFTGRKTGMIDSSLHTLNAATTMTSLSGDANDWALRSYFGRVSYGFDNRYLFEAVMRYDGSSRFAPESRWGFFPALSAGWRISQEGFMQNFNRIIDNLKLRASWGKTGNNASGNYDYQATYASNGYYSFNGMGTIGLIQNKLANPYLKWETTTTINVGLSGTAFKGAFNFDMDVYQGETDGILFVPTIPLTTGAVSAATRNIAQVTKKGIELTLGYQGRVSDFRYSFSGNVAYNYNNVKKYKGALEEGWTTDENGNRVYTSNMGAVSTGTNQRIIEGHRINEYHFKRVYKGNGTYTNKDGSVNINGGPKDGMIRTEADMKWLQAMMDAGYSFHPADGIGKNKIYYGDLIYADYNGDGIYGNAYDSQFIGKNSTPSWNYGFNLNATWKGIDFSMIWAGSAGMSYLWAQTHLNLSTLELGKAVPKLVTNDRYYYNDADPSDPKNNINGHYPRLKSIDTQNVGASDFYLYNASYLKLKNLQIGYTLPERITKKALISRARIFIGGENLLTITKFPGIDPEIGPNLAYPTMRQYTLGLNITF